jgi:hypothetical protein
MDVNGPVAADSAHMLPTLAINGADIIRFGPRGSEMGFTGW